MNTENIFGRKLKQLRVANTLTQGGLGNELGAKGNKCFNKSTIARWENGSRIPDPETVKDLEEILGASRGMLLRAAGHLVEINPEQPASTQIDPAIVKHREDHFADLANIAKGLLTNGLSNVSLPGWTTNRSSHVKYLILNLNSDSGYDEITKEQLESQLNNNMAAILKDKDWFFRYCFTPHLKSELPEELKAESFFKIIEEQPYQLIESLRILAERKTFSGTCPVCEGWSRL